MKYLIHTCNQREWYVNEHLIPLLRAQGITKKDIKVWKDVDGAGNLASFVASCEWIGDNFPLEESTWHLQDDVVISKRFKEVAEREYAGFASGFCNELFDGKRTNYIGNITVDGMWFSFQCILIPNKVAVDFAKWFNEECIPQNLYPEYVSSGKCDDTLFREWAISHVNVPAVNIYPNIADHIDYLIGGTIINQQRKGEKRTAYWRDEYLDAAVDELKERLEKHREREHTQKRNIRG